MGIEGIGFIIGLIGAIWMKSSINLMRESTEQPELKMIGREPENPALTAGRRSIFRSRRNRVGSSSGEPPTEVF